MGNCICQGQCGRHREQCREHHGDFSFLKGFGSASVRKRTDGEVWCGVCWAHEKRRVAEADERREAEAKAKQGRLFG